MESKNQNEVPKVADAVAKLAYALACFLLILPSMIIHSTISGAIKYYRTGYFSNSPNAGSVVIALIFLVCSLGLFFWSRRASRSAGKEHPVFSKKFLIIFSVLFILSGTLYYI
jgi:cytochrome c oxidase subunit IV